MINLTKNIVQSAILTKAHDNYKKELVAHAFLKVHDLTISENLVQDVFLKTWTYLAMGVKIKKMWPFLHQILSNLILDEYRKYSSPSLDALLEKGFDQSTNDADRFLHVLDGKLIFILISRLPTKYKEVLRMRYAHGLSLNEISLITHKPKNSITTQVHRGIKKLRQLCVVQPKVLMTMSNS